MADDIDIEEHDLLDNPKIQSIFPDLAKVKIEREEVENSGSSDDFQDPRSFYTAMTSHLSRQSSSDIEVKNPKNKIILGSKPSSNKIILGSKPIQSPRPSIYKYVDKNDLKLQLKPIVKLENLGPYLNSSKCFCEHCDILFPNPNDFDSHNMTHHSLLVASSHEEVNPFTPARTKNKSVVRRNSDSSSSSKGSKSYVPSRKSDAIIQSKLTQHRFISVKTVRNKAVKSVSKPTLLRRSEVSSTSNKVLKPVMTSRKSESSADFKEETEPCYHCKKTFPNKAMLLEHLYSLLPVPKYNCSKCKINFPTESELKTHEESHLTSLSCNKCEFTGCSHIELLQHQLKIHQDGLEVNKYFCCDICGLMTRVPLNILKHYKENHNITLKKSPKIVTFNGKCRFCTASLSSLTSYSAHLAKLHRSMFIKKVQTQITIPKKDVPKDEVGYKCTLCKAMFDNYHKAKYHRRRAHRDELENSPKIIKKVTLSKPIGTAVPSTLVQTNESLIKADNISQNTSNENARSVEIIYTYKCKICHVTLKTAGQAKHHRAKVHRDIKGTPLIIKVEHKIENTMKNTQNKPAKLYKCTVCNFITKGVYEMRKHRHKNHKELKGQAIVKAIFEIADTKTSYSKAGLAFKPKFISKPVGITKKPKLISRPAANVKIPIPKSVLFKCSKCPMHFLNCSSASVHITKCCNTDDSWECSKCDHSFRPSDKADHEAQHKYTTNFKVYVVHDDILSNVLSRCSDCGIYFDEAKFKQHYKTGCTKIPVSFLCSDCKLRIDVSCKAAHQFRHAIKKFTPDDFITIQYLPTNMIVDIPIPHNQDETKPNLKRKLEDDETDIPRKRGVKKSPFLLMFCSKCHSCVKRNTNNHMNGRCVLFANQNYLCKMCGIKLTKSSINSHTEEHSIYPDAKLNNFPIVNIDNNKRMTKLPVFKYPSCKHCNVHFLTFHEANGHECDDINFIECEICSNKYELSAYAVHEPLHSYKYEPFIKNNKSHKEQGIVKKPLKDGNETEDNISDNVSSLLSKYESLDTTWNILFLCSVCNLAFDSYDVVIEHCHAHFANIVKKPVPVNNCNICDLNIHHNCFEKHTKLHQNDLQKDAFDIIFFEYRNILSDNWLDFSGVLPRAKVQQVISRSIYRDIKDVRLRLVKNGLVSCTLYRCDICSTYVESTSVASHAKNYDDCSRSSKKYLCSYCNIPFLSLASKDAHESLHKTTEIDIKTCRIISFNNVGDKKFNVAMCNIHLSDMIKKERCSDIASNNFEDKTKNKRSTNRPSRYEIYDLAIVKNLDDSTQNNTLRDNNKPAKKTYEDNYNLIYKCNICSLNFLTLNSINSHFSRRNHTLSKYAMTCEHCGLKFTEQSLKRHNHFHIKYNFTIDDITVIPMDSNVGDKNKLMETSGSSDNEEENQAASPQVFKCIKCNIHYTNYSRLLGHVNRNHNDPGSTLPCEFCGLSFSLQTADKHVKLHHSKVKYKLNDLTIRHYTDENGVPVEINLLEMGDEISTRNKSRKLTSEAATNSQRDNKLTSDFKPYKLKLYKCAHCNVHFLEQTKCYKHTSHNHTPMNIREFIECKLCNLQFALQSLQKHLMKDHENDLNLAEVLVEEYDPNNKINNVPKISIYYAIDKMPQSTVVSTTTNQLEDDKSRNKTETVDCNLRDINKALSLSSDKTNIEVIQILEPQILQNPYSSDTEDGKGDVDSTKMSDTSYSHTDLVKDSCNIPDSLPDEKVTSDNCASPNVVEVKSDPQNENFDFECTQKGASDGIGNDTSYAHADLVEDSFNVPDSLPDDKVTSDDCTSPKTMEPQNESSDLDFAQKGVSDDNNMITDVEKSSDLIKSSDSESDSSYEYKCNYCPKKFKANSSRNIHESLDHIDRLKECQICGSCFNASILNDIHLKMVDNRFVCCVCKVHEDIGNLNEHCAVHKKPMPNDH